MQAAKSSRSAPGASLGGRASSACACTRPARSADRPAALPSRKTASISHKIRQSRSSVRSAAASSAAVDTTTQDWQAFSEAVSGEWDGVSITVDRDGDVQLLPEYYVPQAFRDWGVELRDWQTQHSVRADAAGVARTLRRLMPTVGCEADAIAFTEEKASEALRSGAPEELLAQPDGSYSAGPASLAAADLLKASVEAGFPVAAAYRLRVVHLLARGGRDGSWRLAGVELHRERYDGPYTGRRELAGCGGGLPGISDAARTEAAAVAQARWAVEGGVTYTPAAGVQPAAAGAPWSAAGLPGLLWLPHGAWAAFSVDGGDVLAVAGALLEDGSMRVAARRLEGGVLAEAALLRLRPA